MTVSIARSNMNRIQKAIADRQKKDAAEAKKQAAVSYPPLVGQFLTVFKLLFAPADRVNRFGSAASRPWRAAARHEQCADAGDCRSSSMLPRPPSPANRPPKHAGKRTRTSGISRQQIVAYVSVRISGSSSARSSKVIKRTP